MSSERVTFTTEQREQGQYFTNHITHPGVKFDSNGLPVMVIVDRESFERSDDGKDAGTGTE